jgi:hypothetical protein
MFRLDREEQLWLVELVDLPDGGAAVYGRDPFERLPRSTSPDRPVRRVCDRGTRRTHPPSISRIRCPHWFDRGLGGSGTPRERPLLRRHLALAWADSFQAKQQLPSLGHPRTAASTLLRNRQASPYDYIPISELCDHIHGGIEQATLAAEAGRAVAREQQAARPTLRGWPSLGLAPADSESDAA